VDIHHLEDADLKFVWAAYRLGALTSLAPVFERPGMKSQEFAEVFVDHLLANFTDAWIAEAETLEGFKPAGLIIVWTRGRVIEIGDMVWFPWASARNTLESVVKFMDQLRRDFVVLEFARIEDKKFFERVAAHGVMRKIGHAHSIYPNGPAVLFETIRKE
jgi:hypothetical protein